MIKYNVDSLAERLVNANKNILILDTCCLLDIIRCIEREKPSILESVIEIFDLFDKNQNTFEIVLPSLIETEWTDNCTFVRTKTDDYIKESDRMQKNLIHFVKMIYPTPLQNTYFSQFDLGKRLSDFSEKLLNLCLCLESINESTFNAHQRVSKHIPPAKKGKDSYKDCEIFEEMLFLGNLLRRKGFIKKIIFATSNTEEYYKDDKPIPEIKQDLSKFNIEIVTSLNHGYHLVKND